MKLLITGGAGFIGSNFIHYWFKHHPKDEITNYDKLSYAGNLANLKSVERLPNYRFIKADILDRDAVQKALGGVDTVVHFAAESHVTRSEDAPEECYKNNVGGTKALLEVAAHFPLKKFIHLSTDEIYGPIGEGYFSEEDKRPGDKQASSAYAKSKALADDLARSYFGKSPVVIVRPTNNFGPFQHLEKALPRWITSALLDMPLYVWGKGNQVRDWLFAEDTARALELIIDKAEPGSIFNVGANHKKEYTNHEIATMVLKELGKPLDLLKKIPDPRADHDFRYGVGTDKIKILGWQPGSFSGQFKFTVKWYRDNPGWWQPLKAEAEALYAKRERK